MSDIRDIAVKYAHLLSAPDYSRLLNEADLIAVLEEDIEDSLTSLGVKDKLIAVLEDNAAADEATIKGLSEKGEELEAELSAWEATAQGHYREAFKLKEENKRIAELEQQNTFWACKKHHNNNTLRCAICDEADLKRLSKALEVENEIQD